MYDSLKTEEEDSLNFFRVYKGTLMTSAVIEWWKVFGNDTDDCHWKNLFAEGEHKSFRDKFNADLQENDPECDLENLWAKIRDYRHNYAAHLNFDEANRTERRHPFLAPLRITAEILYSKVHQELSDLDSASGFPSPENVKEHTRSKILDHWTLIANAAREALKEFNNEP